VDLERLYLVERLSAMKIANAYNLHYKSQKVAESTILYYLNRNGIKRRDPAELARKVNETIVDEWVARYRAGESLKQIAGGDVSPVTVWNHLRLRGLSLRNKVEAQIQAVTKHERRPFAGDVVERAYLMGLRFGDLDAVKHGRAVRLRVSTTHPAMAELFESLFSSYGLVHRYPRRAKLTKYEWTLECDLDDTFQFLLQKVGLNELGRMTKQEFLGFLAGFFDAEGSIYYHKKDGWGGFEWTLANTDRQILVLIGAKLRRLSLHPKLWENRSARKGIMGSPGFTSPAPLWRLGVWRFREVKSLLLQVPLRHREKLARARVSALLEYRAGGDDRQAVLEKWESMRNQFKDEVSDFIRNAREELESRRENQLKESPI
jgi:hypothetical protein